MVKYIEKKECLSSQKDLVIVFDTGYQIFYGFFSRLLEGSGNDTRTTRYSKKTRERRKKNDGTIKKNDRDLSTRKLWR